MNQAWFGSGPELAVSASWGCMRYGCGCSALSHEGVRARKEARRGAHSTATATAHARTTACTMPDLLTHTHTLLNTNAMLRESAPAQSADDSHWLESLGASARHCAAPVCQKAVCAEALACGRLVCFWVRHGHSSNPTWSVYFLMHSHSAGINAAKQVVHHVSISVER